MGTINRPLTNWVRSVIIIGSGASLAFVSLAVYSWNVSQNWGNTAMFAGYEDQLAYSTLIFLLAGLSVCGFGSYRLIRNVATSGSSRSGFSSIFSKFMMSSQDRLIMLVGIIVYAVFFAIVSGILVFQSSPAFSHEYGVNVPSVNVVECCGSIGQVPVFVVYLSENIGLLIVPLNIVIMFVVSFLVGLNSSIGWFAYRELRVPFTMRGWTSFFGAGVGLFTACPTCSSFFISSLIGLSGTFTVAAGATWLQPLLILLGLSILCIGPIVIARTARTALSCTISPR